MDSAVYLDAFFGLEALGLHCEFEKDIEAHAVDDVLKNGNTFNIRNIPPSFVTYILILDNNLLSNCFFDIRAYKRRFYRNIIVEGDNVHFTVFFSIQFR